jgi:hypothetical protein
MSSAEQQDERYIMSVIRMPLRVHRDGTYTTLDDRIVMSFEAWEGPPPPVSDENSRRQSTEELNALLSSLKHPIPSSNPDPSPSSNPDPSPSSNPDPSPSSNPDPSPSSNPDPNRRVGIDPTKKTRYGRPTTFKNYRQLQRHVEKHVAKGVDHWVNSMDPPSSNASNAFMHKYPYHRRTMRVLPG